VLLPTSIPYEKYRFFREVSAVAKQIKADAVYYVSDAFLLDDAGQRTGKEGLMAAVVNPDASAVSASAVYTRRKHPMLKHDIIEFSREDGTGKLDQWLIPAWGTVQLN
jgi:hypothetical protein